MEISVMDVEHGACAIMQTRSTEAVAMIDCGHNGYTGWNPANHLRQRLKKNSIEHLIITNTDQDHYSNLAFLENQIFIQNLYYNSSVSHKIFRALKSQSGPLSRDAQTYAKLRQNYTAPVQISFEDEFAGVTMKTFCNAYPEFIDFNNLSLVVFLSYRGVTCLFPGDLEKAGWLALLRNSEFRSWLSRTNIFVASHHGREGGYADEVFDHCAPAITLISDKPIVHQTQTKSASLYGRHSSGLWVTNGNTTNFRSVLTTRNDGWIHLSVNDNGSLIIRTER